MPVRFNHWLLETRMHAQDCVYRRYVDGDNGTKWENYAFGMEMALHEVLLASPHRTLNPEDADFFFAPVYGGCYISRFFRPTVIHNLIMQQPEWRPAPVLGNQFYREAYGWVRDALPYWNRSGGADHIFAFPHDEGACVAPIELKNSILLTSWGRLQKRPHNATTSMNEHSWYVPAYVKDMYASEQCFLPGKDVLMPVFTSISQLRHSPHLRPDAEKPPLGPRGILFHWRGQVLYRFPHYSLGIRQQVHTLFRGREAEGLVVSSEHSSHYLSEMLNSTFCGVFPGNGWGHIETPILLGCIPVVVQDEILTPWEDVLDLPSFAVRLPRRDLPNLPAVLRAIPREHIVQMQIAISRVWERFSYSSVGVAEAVRRCGSLRAARTAGTRRGRFATRECRQLDGYLRNPAITGRDAIDTLMHLLQAKLLARQHAERA